MKTLLGFGADVNLQTGKFKTALLAAVFHGHDDVVQILLDAGADVNLAGVAGPPIMIASLKGYDTVAQMLLNAGAHVNTQGPCPFGALIEASQQGHTAVVQTLLQAGAGADDMEGAHLGYATALQAASAHGHVEIVQYLLSAGADVNAPGNPYMAL